MMMPTHATAVPSVTKSLPVPSNTWMPFLRAVRARPVPTRRSVLVLGKHGDRGDDHAQYRDDGHGPQRAWTGDHRNSKQHDEEADSCDECQSLRLAYHGPKAGQLGRGANR